MTFLIRDQGFVPLLMERRESALPLPSGNVMLIGVGVLPFFLYEFKPGSICLLWDSFPFRAPITLEKSISRTSIESVARVEGIEALLQSGIEGRA